MPDPDAVLLQTRARAIMEERRRRNVWASVRPMVEYQRRPLAWITDHMGVPEATLRWSLSPEYATHKWDGDVDPLAHCLEALADWKDVGIESGTGCGKSFLAALIIFWFVACFEDSIVVTVAPKEDQLLKHIWKEAGSLYPRFKVLFPKSEFLTGTLRMKPAEEGKEKWAAHAFVCGVGADETVATKAQGFHAEHMLIITEETPGIHPAIMSALYNTRSDDHNLQLGLGNPDHQQDELHRFCMEDGVVHLRMSALDHPNIVTGRSIVPGAVGRNRLERRTKKLGLGSRLYNSRVRGISPPEAEDALIKRAWCEDAAKKWADPAYRAGALALGADVADAPQGDPAAIARWQGACLTEVQAFNVRDANAFAQIVFTEAMNPLAPVDPRYIGLDSVGVGASAKNELQRLGLKVRLISGGMRSVPGLDEDSIWSETTEIGGRLRPAGPRVVEAERFDNLRSQVWWRMREDLRMGKIALPDDPELFEDLCTPTWTPKNGKIVVEPKKDIIARLKRSPNKGDAACYGNFVRRRAPLARPAADPGLVTSRDTDIGLERKLARLKRVHDAEERKIRRMFAQERRLKQRRERERFL